MVFDRIKNYFKKDKPTNNVVKVRIEKINGNIVDDFLNTMERGNGNE